VSSSAELWRTTSTYDAALVRHHGHWCTPAPHEKTTPTHSSTVDSRVLCENEILSQLSNESCWRLCNSKVNLLTKASIIHQD